MRLIIYIFTAILLFLPAASKAAEPFGLKIGSMTLVEFEANYDSYDNGTNTWTGGPMKKISSSELKMDGLKSAIVIFDKDNVLVGLLLIFPKSKFDSLNKLAKEQYLPVRSVIPYVGNKSVIYRDKDTEIRLTAPHMSFEMEMNFLHQTLIELHESGRQKAADEKREAEKNALFGQ